MSKGERATSILPNSANIPLEQYESELERMNKDLSAENYSLQHDNKQLSSLLREYEQSLETIMAAFRSQAVRIRLRVSYTQPNNFSLLARGPTTRVVVC